MDTASRRDRVHNGVFASSPRFCPAVILHLLLLTTGLASAGALKTTTGLFYPLDGLSSSADLAARTTTGGGWLYGAEGHPPYPHMPGCVHAAIDVRADEGDTVYAIAGGKVHAYTGPDKNGFGVERDSEGRLVVGRGGAIVVTTIPKEGAPFHIIYGHTKNHRIGDTVVAGEPMAQIGPWINTTHLHLAVKYGDMPSTNWGTPRTASEADVADLGYRDPLWFMHQQRTETTTDVIEKKIEQVTSDVEKKVEKEIHKQTEKAKKHVMQKISEAIAAACKAFINGLVAFLKSLIDGLLKKLS